MGAGAFETAAELIVKSGSSYRGVKQAFDGKAVYQGQIEVRHESGVYAGVWTSRLHSEVDGRDLEVDYFAGYQRRWTNRFATDVTFQRYTYHGADFGSDYDWNELQFAAHIGDHLSLLAAAGDNWIGRDERSYVAEATYRHAFTNRLSGYATVGRQFAMDVVSANFTYRELGLGIMVGGFDVQVGWSDSAGLDRSPFLTDDTWHISLSRRFSFGR